MVKSLTVRVLVEDSTREGRGKLLAQHGVSLFVEAETSDGRTSLFMDTGPSAEVIAHNMEAIKLDLRGVVAIILSHGHYDHLGGTLQVLKVVGRPIPVIAHPKAFSPKIVLTPTIRFAGSPFSLSEMRKAGGIPLLASNPVQIAEGITTSGEVKRETEFEETEGFWTIENERFVEDRMPDDQAVILDLGERGLAVLTGCAHSGIVNTIRTAQKVTSRQRICAVIGGLHLHKAGEERVARTVEELLKLNLQLIAPCHCTGMKAASQLIQAFGERCRPLRTGDLVIL